MCILCTDNNEGAVNPLSVMAFCHRLFLHVEVRVKHNDAVYCQSLRALLAGLMQVTLSSGPV